MSQENTPRDAGPEPAPATSGATGADGTKTRVGRRATLVGALMALGFAGLMITTIVSIAIWPGEAKLTAPLFCDEQYPDPYVVSDTYTSGGETTTNYTLYCVGDRGQARDEGFFWPFMALWALHSAVVLVLLVVPPWLGGVFRLGRPRPMDLPDDVVMPDIIADR